MVAEWHTDTNTRQQTCVVHLAEVVTDLLFGWGVGWCIAFFAFGLNIVTPLVCYEDADLI